MSAAILVVDVAWRAEAQGAESRAAFPAEPAAGSPDAARAPVTATPNTASAPPAAATAPTAVAVSAPPVPSAAPNPTAAPAPGAAAAPYPSNAPPVTPEAGAEERARAYAAWQNAYAAWQYQQPREPPRRWYGWQTLIADGGMLVLFAATSATDNSSSSSDTAGALALAGFLDYLFVPPIIHAAHGHWGKAGASFAVRAGSTVLLTAGLAECIDSDRRCNQDGGNVLLVLGLIGFIGAIPLDAALIAREDVPPGEEAHWTLSPWVDATKRGAGVSLRSAF